MLLLVATPVLAGCLGETDDPVSATAARLGIAPAAVMSFTGEGEQVPLGDVVGETTYLLSGHNGAEPNVGITQSGAIFATARDAVIRSIDGGATWEVVYRLGLERLGGPFEENDPIRNSDPMLWVDPWTDRVYNSPMWPLLTCTWLSWSEDDGASWVDRPGVCHPPPMDHQKFASGPPGPDALPPAGVTHPTVLYQCYNMLLSTNCAVSYTGGVDWVVHQVAADNVRGDCGGINGHPAVSGEGIVAVPLTRGCSEASVAISTDSGLSWTLRPVPGTRDPQSIDPEVSWSPDGILYFSYREDGLTYLARSPDAGATWEGPFLVTPPDVTNTVFHVLAAGSDGDLAVAFLGTRDSEGDPSEAPDETRWYLFIVTTEDAGAEMPVFTSRQVNPDDDPVQVGCVWLRGGGNPCRNMLDFIDGAVDPNTGVFHVVYTEGCTEGCAGNTEPTPDDSRDRQVALARLDGWSLSG